MDHNSDVEEMCFVCHNGRFVPVSGCPWCGKTEAR